MRPIKFRAWDDKNKKWLLGYDYPNIGGFSLWGEIMLCGEWSNILNKMAHGDFGEEGDELKIMQFTGLHDKNGKEIYEGDIVQYEGDTGFEIITIQELVVFKGACFYPVCTQPEDTCEVIGNIYENPALCP